MRLIFMGSPEFAVPSLKKLASIHEISSVYSQPPRASGRGMAERLTAVAEAATELGISARWPISLKAADIQAEIASETPDAIIVVAYGLLLPQAVLDIPKYGCINGHASLLPRWRGAAPIQRAIEAGDTQTGITTMQMEAGLDTGPMLLTHPTTIDNDDTAGTLHDRLADMTATCLVETLDALQAGALSPQTQADDGITYAAKINTQETEIDFNQTAEALAYKIRAFSPFPGCWLMGKSGKRLKLLMAQDAAISASKYSPSSYPKGTYPNGIYLGQSETGDLLISAAEGAIAVRQLQPAGKKPMPARDFLNGKALVIGQSIHDQL